MLEAIFKNLLGFDFIIMVLAVANGGIFYMALKSAQKLAGDLSTDGVWQADMRKDEKSTGRRLADKEIIALRNKAELWYTWYVNISAIFPLLGILGTVTALIGMQSSGMTADNSFLLALTSTFWGLIFSIVFKSMQTIIESRLDEGVREAERCLGIVKDTEDGNEKA